MDLQISSEMYISRRLPYTFKEGVLNPHDQSSIDAAFQRFSLPAELISGRQALLSTASPIYVPVNYVGFIGLRSTWARLGLMAPLTIADPGFSGTLTLEVFNASENRIKLLPGDVVFSLTFGLASPDSQPYNGRYQNQSGLTLPIAL